MRDVVTALSHGLAISIAAHNTMLTTQEAADLLNISRPTLVRLLTDGEIPLHHPRPAPAPSSARLSRSGRAA